MMRTDDRGVNAYKTDSFPVSVFASGAWHKLFQLFVEMVLIFSVLNNCSRDLLIFLVCKHDVIGLIELGNMRL